MPRDVRFRPDVLAPPMAKLDFDAASGEPLNREFGPYRLVRRLGVGGMAETFEAIRQGPSGFAQRVCLKLVLPFFRDDEEFVRLFEREARLAAKLRHSNIVGVIDFGEIGGRAYMALELVDGVDLQVLLDAQSGKRLSPEQVALLGHDLAAALEHAHHPPRESDFDGSRVSAIVHRDISPSNVLISRHGEILLTDFGVAKAVTGSSRKQSAIKGKIPYMSPEQLRAESIDGRADLFGVGVVLFEALAGQRPFEGAHDPATIMQILQGDHPPLCSLAPGAPPGLCEVIECLIEPDRDARPESAAALIDLLDPFVPTPRIRRQLGAMVAELRPEREAPISGYPAEGWGDEATELRDDAEEAERKKRTSGIVGAGESQSHIDAQEALVGPHAESSPEKPGSTRRSRGLLIGASLAVLLMLGGGTAWWSSRSAESKSSQTAPVENELLAAADEQELTKPSSAQRTAENPAAAEKTAVGTDADPEREQELKSGADPQGLANENPANANAADDESAKREATAPPTAPQKRSGAVVPPADLSVFVFPWGNVWINGKSRGSAPLKAASLKPGRYRISVGQGSPSKSQSVRLRPGESKTLHFDLTK